MSDEDILRVVAEGKFTEVAHFLVQGESANAVDPKSGDTCLHLAAKNGYSKIVLLLLRYKARLVTTNKAGRTAIEEAAYAGQWETVIAIAQKKRQVYFDPEYYNWTFWLAVDSNKMEAVDALLKAGAEPTKVNEDKETCLHSAAKNNNPEMVNKLIDLKLCIHEVDSRRQKPFDVALQNKSLDCAYLLVPDKNSFDLLREVHFTEITVSKDKQKKEKLVVLFCGNTDDKNASQNDLKRIEQMASWGYVAACSWMVNYYKNKIEKESSAILKKSYTESMFFFMKKIDAPETESPIENPGSEKQRSVKAVKGVLKFSIKPVEKEEKNPEQSLWQFFPPPPSPAKALGTLAPFIPLDGAGMDL